MFLLIFFKLKDTSISSFFLNSCQLKNIEFKNGRRKKVCNKISISEKEILIFDKSTKEVIIA